MTKTAGTGISVAAGIIGLIGLSVILSACSPESDASSVALILSRLIALFYKFAMIIASAWLVLAFIIGGLLYMTAGIEPKNAERAKNMIKSAFIGVILVFAGYLLLNMISSKLVRLTPGGIRQIQPAGTSHLKKPAEPAETQ